MAISLSPYEQACLTVLHAEASLPILAHIVSTIL